jgi:NTP pyrophosphatase (non-canonical NTP hydrolase)
MNFLEYQEKSRKTALYPTIGANFVYPALGLANEAGEVAGKIKKIFRDDGGEVTLERKKKIEEEMGDVLWYLSQLATDLELSLDVIAQKNLDKLMSRLERNKLHGDGDNR